jgi:2-oxoglutarate dehydrogenase E1 component
MLAGDAARLGLRRNAGLRLLLEDGFLVRITGQDVRSRHLLPSPCRAAQPEPSPRVHVPLQHLGRRQPRVRGHRFGAVEEAVMGFEYGYSTTEPNALVIWEASSAISRTARRS